MAENQRVTVFFSPPYKRSYIWAPRYGLNKQFLDKRSCTDICCCLIYAAVVAGVLKRGFLKPNFNREHRTQYMYAYIFGNCCSALFISYILYITLLYDIIHTVNICLCLCWVIVNQGGKSCFGVATIAASSRN